MKKFFLLTLIFSFILTLCSFKSLESDDKKELKPLVKNNENFVEYRYISDSNEHITQAINLTPTDYYNNGSYTISYNDTLTTQNGLIDIDFYSFEICKNSKIDLKITTNSITSFEVYLQYLENNVYSETLSTTLGDIYYDLSKNKSKIYSGTLDSGSYYIILKGMVSPYYNENINYNIDLQIKEQIASNTAITINEMVKLSTIGFYYGINYSKLNNIGFFDYDRKIRLDKNDAQDVYLHNYLKNRLYEPVCLGSLYVYDKTINDNILTICKGISQTLCDSIANDIKKAKEIKYTIEEIDGKINIMLDVLGKQHEFLSEVIGISKDLVVNICDSLILKGLLNLNVDLVDYMGVIKGFLIPSQGTTVIHDIIEFPLIVIYDGEYITINPVIYLKQIVDKQKIARENNTYLIDTNTSIRCLDCYSSNNNKCSKCKSFDTTRFNSYFKYIESIPRNIMELSTYANKHSYTYKFIEKEAAHQHSYSYRYIDLKTHQCICSCGYKMISGHLLNKPYDKYCSLCGGRAESGLIGPSNCIYYERTNDLYISRMPICTVEKRLVL